MLVSWMFDSRDPASILASQPRIVPEAVIGNILFSLDSIQRLQDFQMNEEFGAKKVSASFYQVPIR